MCDFFSFMAYREGKEMEIFFTPQTNSHTEMAEILWGDDHAEDNTWKFEISPNIHGLIDMPQTPEELQWHYDGGRDFSELLPMEKWGIIQQLERYRDEIDFMAWLRNPKPETLLQILQRRKAEKLQLLLEFPRPENVNINIGRGVKTFRITGNPSQYWFWVAYVHKFRTNMGDEASELRSFIYEVEYNA